MSNEIEVERRRWFCLGCGGEWELTYYPKALGKFNARMIFPPKCKTKDRCETMAYRSMGVDFVSEATLKEPSHG